LSLKTKSIYEVKENSDGVRVLITRFYPRGIEKSRFDLWLRQASPEPALLKKYKSDKIDWKEFSREFRKQMRTSVESKKAILELIELLGREKDVTLLCYEKEGLNCHRYLVKAIVEIKIKREKKKTETCPSRPEQRQGRTVD
jgi:uncharacterized protein YeaO (DUF488 family)